MTHCMTSTFYSSELNAGAFFVAPLYFTRISRLLEAYSVNVVWYKLVFATSNPPFMFFY